MKAAYYLRAQTFEAPSIKHTKVQFTIKSDEDKACRTNIMFDNRVCRGNTYSNPVITEDQKRNQRVYEREQAARLRHQDILRNRQTNFRNGTPPPVRGRIHASIQTDGSLAEIFAEGENLDIVMMRNGENSGEGSTAIVGNDPSLSRTEVKEVHKEEKNEGDFPCIGTSEIARKDSNCSENSNADDTRTTKENMFTENFTKLVLEEAKKNAIDKQLQFDYCSDTD